MTIHSILVVDDDAATTNAMQRVLEPLGYDVTTAVGGQRAVWFLERGEYDLVITDILMPEGDGFELIDTLRRDYPEVRVIAVSAGAGEGSLAADTILLVAHGMRADAVLQKPVTRDNLVSAIKTVESR